jgi:hypothetical protein
MNYRSPSKTQFPLLDFAVSVSTGDRSVAHLLGSGGVVSSAKYRRNLQKKVLILGDSLSNQSVAQEGIVRGIDREKMEYCYL